MRFRFRGHPKVANFKVGQGDLYPKLGIKPGRKVCWPDAKPGMAYAKIPMPEQQGKGGKERIAFRVSQRLSRLFVSALIRLIATESEID